MRVAVTEGCDIKHDWVCPAVVVSKSEFAAMRQSDVQSIVSTFSSFNCCEHKVERREMSAIKSFLRHMKSSKVAFGIKEFNTPRPFRALEICILSGGNSLCIFECDGLTDNGYLSYTVRCVDNRIKM